jgi:hypothetical protein
MPTLWFVGAEEKMREMKAISPILLRPVEQFETIEEFKEMCVLNNFKTLSDIVKYPVSQLLKKPGFGMRVLKDLIRILMENKLENVLKD